MLESGDDLNPVSASGFGRLGGVGVDGGLTGLRVVTFVLSGRFEWGWVLVGYEDVGFLLFL